MVPAEGAGTRAGSVWGVGPPTGGPVARAPLQTLDEVRWAPGLLIAIKRAVDRKRQRARAPPLGRDARRTASGDEVDFVIEVKATSRPRVSDGRHPQAFREEYGKSARAGLVLQTRSMIEWLAPGVLASPWWAVV